MSRPFDLPWTWPGGLLGSLWECFMWSMRASVPRKILWQTGQEVVLGPPIRAACCCKTSTRSSASCNTKPKTSNIWNESATPEVRDWYGFRCFMACWNPMGLSNGLIRWYKTPWTPWRPAGTIIIIQLVLTDSWTASAPYNKWTSRWCSSSIGARTHQIICSL